MKFKMIYCMVSRFYMIQPNFASWWNKCIIYNMFFFVKHNNNFICFYQLPIEVWSYTTMDALVKATATFEFYLLFHPCYQFNQNHFTWIINTTLQPEKTLHLQHSSREEGQLWNLISKIMLLLFYVLCCLYLINKCIHVKEYE